jgi:hypothetical protein
MKSTNVVDIGVSSFASLISSYRLRVLSSLGGLDALPRRGKVVFKILAERANP